MKRNKEEQTVAPDVGVNEQKKKLKKQHLQPNVGGSGSGDGDKIGIIGAEKASSSSVLTSSTVPVAKHHQLQQLQSDACSSSAVDNTGRTDESISSIPTGTTAPGAFNTQQQLQSTSSVTPVVQHDQQQQMQSQACSSSGSDGINTGVIVDDN